MKKFKTILAIMSLMMIMCSVRSVMAVPNRPTLLSPADKDSCVAKEIMFVWQQEASVSGYVLQVATDVGFTAMVCNEPLTPTFITYNLPSYNTKYWWRVIVNFTNGTIDTSDVRNFKVKYSAPTDIYPVNIQNCVPTNMTFSWTRPSGTSKYRLEVSDTATFSYLYLDTLLNNVSSFNWKAPANSKTYFWRICTVIRSDCSSEWSTVNRFSTAYKAPFDLSPADSTIGCEQSVLLDWNYDMENESFSLKVSENADMSEPFIDVENLAVSNFTLSNLKLNTNYYWQVNAVVNGCASDWSAIHRLTVKYPSPELMSPNTDATCISKTVAFLWHAVQMARGYSLLVSTQAEFADTVAYLININDTVAVVELPGGKTKYFWKVKADDSRNFGSWSAYNSFTTTYAEPLLTGVDENYVFRWKSDYKDIEYIIQVAASNEFSSGSMIVNDTANGGRSSSREIDFQYIPDSSALALLKYNTQYFWRIKAIDNLNCNGMWSATESFRTLLESPTLIYPASGEKNVVLNPTFLWNGVSGGDKYEIQVAKANALDSNGNFVTIEKESYQITATEITFSGLDPETQYAWHVRARCDDGRTSKWTAAIMFETKIAAPAAPVPESPADHSVKISLDTLFSWLPVDKALRYELVISTDPKAVSGIFKNVTTDSTEIFVEGLVVYTDYYWKVAAINDGGRSTWSQIFTFRTIAPKLQQGPVLSYPANGASNLEKQTALKWNVLATCLNYHLQVSETADFSALTINDSTISKTTYNFISPNFAETYYWRVAGINEIGEGPWSEIWSFGVKDGSGVEDVDNMSAIRISPNPVENMLHLTTVGEFSAFPCKIIISDESGNLVYSAGYPAVPSEIAIDKLASGVYLLIIESADKSRRVKKFTVAR